MGRGARDQSCSAEQRQPSQARWLSVRARPAPIRQGLDSRGGPDGEGSFAPAPICSVSADMSRTEPTEPPSNIFAKRDPDLSRRTGGPSSPRFHTVARRHHEPPCAGGGALCALSLFELRAGAMSGIVRVWRRLPFELRRQPSDCDEVLDLHELEHSAPSV